MALTAAITLLIPETKGKTIEEIEHGVLYGESLQASGTSVSSGNIEAVSDHFKADTAADGQEKETV